MTSFVRTRLTADGAVRFQVLYRLGGRGPLKSAGTFASAADAEKTRLRVVAARAAGQPPRDEVTGAPLVYIGELGGLLKIGISVDPERRCRDLNARLLHVEPGGRARERELHHMFRHLRTSGEFFRPGRFGEIRRYITRCAERRASGSEAMSPTEGMRPSVV